MYFRLERPAPGQSGEAARRAHWCGRPLRNVTFSCSARNRASSASNTRCRITAPPVENAAPTTIETLPDQKNPLPVQARTGSRAEEHTSELQSLMRISYAVFCLKKKKRTTTDRDKHQQQ